MYLDLSLKYVIAEHLVGEYQEANDAGIWAVNKEWGSSLNKDKARAQRN